MLPTSITPIPQGETIGSTGNIPTILPATKKTKPDVYDDKVVDITPFNVKTPVGDSSNKLPNTPTGAFSEIGSWVDKDNQKHSIHSSELQNTSGGPSMTRTPWKDKFGSEYKEVNGSFVPVSENKFPDSGYLSNDAIGNPTNTVPLPLRNSKLTQLPSMNT